MLTTTKGIERPLDFIHHLEQIMTDPTCRSFFDEYFKTWGDIKATLMLIKAYLMIDTETNRIYGRSLPPTVISDILRHVIKDSETRRYLVDSMEKFMKESNQNFNQICHQILIEKYPELVHEFYNSCNTRKLRGPYKIGD